MGRTWRPSGVGWRFPKLVAMAMAELSVMVPEGGTLEKGRVKLNRPLGEALVMVTSEPGPGVAPLAVGVNVDGAAAATHGQRRVGEGGRWDGPE